MGRAPHRRPRRTPRRCARSRRAVEHVGGCSRSRPEVVAHDLHPDYLSTALRARARVGVELVGVQHHHAHLAACLAEHGERGPAVGAIFDGTGYGLDGTVWGGELLVGDLAGFRRAGHLLPVRLPGGDAGGPPAVADGVRVAGGGAGRRAAAAAGLRAVRRPARWAAVAGSPRPGLASPWTTSAGRLFDAVAALCGLRAEVTLRGPGGDRAGGRRRPGRARRLPARGRRDGGPLVLDPREAILAVPPTSPAGVPAGVVAARFHAGLAAATAAACARARRARAGLDTVVLSGGVFQNRRLLEAHRARRSRRAGCACSCRSACRPTTAASPTARRRSRRRGLRKRRDRLRSGGPTPLRDRSAKGGTACEAAVQRRCAAVIPMRRFLRREREAPGERLLTGR